MSQCYEFNYTSNQPQLLPNVWTPCPAGDNCCIGIDTCLSNNLCRAYTGGTEKRAGDYSGYYNARCTDPTYTSPACDKICIGSAPDLVYNYTLQAWACCGNNTAGEVTCNNPLPEYYAAPQPALLVTLSKGAIFASTATLTPVGTSLGTASTTLTSQSPTRSSGSSISYTATATNLPTQGSISAGLSTGAKTGIGIGVAVGALVLVVGLILLLRRRRTGLRHDPVPQEVDTIQPRSMQEMPDTAKRVPIEIDSSYGTVASSEQECLAAPSDHFSFEAGQSTHLSLGHRSGG